MSVPGLVADLRQDSNSPAPKLQGLPPREKEQLRKILGRIEKEQQCSSLLVIIGDAGSCCKVAAIFLRRRCILRGGSLHRGIGRCLSELRGKMKLNICRVLSSHPG